MMGALGRPWPAHLLSQVLLFTPLCGRSRLRRVKGKHTHTDIDIHPRIQTDIHADTHPDIRGKSVSSAPYRLGSNLHSRSRELATCALGGGRKC